MTASVLCIYGNAQVSPDTPVPLDYRYLVENFVGLVPSATTAGGRHVTEADGVYLVESSRRYVLVVFADKPTDVARFCVLVAAQPHCTVHVRYVGYSLVMVIVWRLGGNIIRTAPCWVV